MGCAGEELCFSSAFGCNTFLSLNFLPVSLSLIIERDQEDVYLLLSPTITEGFLQF